MAPRMPNIFRHSGAEREEPPVNMTREEEQAIVQAMIQNLLATNPVTTPAPPAPRWSRTSYSISIYTEDSRFDEDTSTLRAPTPVECRPNASVSAGNTSEKDCMTPRRLWISVTVFLVLSIVAIIIVLQVHHTGGDSGPSSTPTHKSTASTAASTNQQHGAELHSITDSDPKPSASTTSTSTSQQPGAAGYSITKSGPTSSASSTVAVVQIATDIVRTTIGTLTTSAVTSAATSSRTSIQNTTFSA